METGADLWRPHSGNASEGAGSYDPFKRRTATNAAWLTCCTVDSSMSGPCMPIDYLHPEAAGSNLSMFGVLPGA